MDGILVLEDGRFFRGRLFGSVSVGPEGGAQGEVVFNTSFSGYQEILTDPSYAGQIVTFTYPHIGNYGINAEDIESGRIAAAGLIVRDHHEMPSNWRSQRSLGSYLEEAGMTGLSGVDTRALVLHLRERGACRGLVRRFDVAGRRLPLGGQVVVTDEGTDDVARIAALAREAAALPSMAGQDLASRVTCAASWQAGDAQASLHVVALDFGIKLNIVRQLQASGCRVTVMPSHTSATDILALRPDGVLLSNGPGDPEAVTYAVVTIRELLGKIPLFGICLGHQLLGLACGGSTYKLKFGHRGSNHPVRDIESGRIEITSQNHGFAVNASSLDGREVAVSHLHLHDDTVAGLKHRRYPAFSVQYHPEASPGPHDSHHLFERFVDSMVHWRRIHPS